MRALITGGAGFIGSSLVDLLLRRGDDVAVLDDFCTGFRENVPDGVELFEGTVADADLVRKAVEGAELVVHLAAHRAVFRSVQQPLATDTANIHGTLTVLDASREAGVRRLVYASSSSVYGGAAPVPTPESAPLLPRSPYAVTKLAGEHYCRVYAELFGLETVALRFFNVYGPRQRPDSQYAAVIPLFIDALRNGLPPTVHGDGLQTRDFTYIGDLLAGLMAAAETPADVCSGRVYNLACNEQHSLLDLLDILGELLGARVAPEFTDPRPGDVRLSQADPSAAARDLGWKAEIGFAEGLASTVDWFTRTPLPG